MRTSRLGSITRLIKYEMANPKMLPSIGIMINHQMSGGHFQHLQTHSQQQDRKHDPHNNFQCSFTHHSPD